MKKLLVSALAFAFLLTATGCSSSGNKNSADLVCKYSGTMSGLDVESTQTYENNGTKITKAVIEAIMTSDSYTADDYQSMKEYYESLYGSYEGIEFTGEVIENGLKYSVTIDVEKASNDDLVAIGFLDSSSSKADYIDLDLTKESLEEQGYTCSQD